MIRTRIDRLIKTTTGHVRSTGEEWPTHKGRDRRRRRRKGRK